MVRWFYDLHERLPEGVICRYFIEANFLQDILLDEFATEGKLRGYQLPIRPTNARNRTNSSVSRRFRRCGNVASSFTTRTCRTTLICWQASNRPFPSKKEAGHMMTARMRTKGLSMYYKSIHECRSLNRVSAHAGLLKICGNDTVYQRHDSELQNKTRHPFGG